jgi:hypothetical protein
LPVAKRNPETPPQGLTPTAMATMKCWWTYSLGRSDLAYRHFR